MRVDFSEREVLLMSLKSWIRCSALALVLLAVGILSEGMLGQGGGTAPQSNRSVSIAAVSPFITVSTNTTQFIEIFVTENAFLYLFDYAPKGKTSLLLAPSKLTPQVFLEAGKSYIWPRDFSDGELIIPNVTGEHLIEAVVTPQQINLFAPPETSSETFTPLGSDPDEIRARVTTLIAAHGITSASWSLDSRRVFYDPLPISGSPSNSSDLYADLFILMKDNGGNLITGNYSPQVLVDGDRELSKLTVNFNGSPQGTRVEKLHRENTRASLAPSATNHILRSNNPCRVTFADIAEAADRSKCTLNGSDLAFRGKILITFTLDRDTEPVAAFYVRPTEIGIDQEVLFDASPSGPESKIKSYSWDFGDNITSTGKQATHKYGQIGDYSATLTIITSDNRTITTNPQPVSVGTGTAECSSQDATQPGLCIDLKTEEMSVQNFSSAGADVVGKKGVISLAYNLLPPDSLATFPAGPASGRVGFRVNEFPNATAVSDLRADVESLIAVHFINQNPNLNSRAPLDFSQDAYFVRKRVSPALATNQQKTINFDIPAGTVMIRYQLYTSVALNQPNETISISFFDFGFESLKCEDDFIEKGRATYAIGERISFIFCNVDSTEITLENSAPWVIKSSSNGEVIFTPVATAGAITLKPGEFLRGEWDQATSTNLVAAPGNYVIEFKTSAGSFSTTVKIQSASP